MNGDGDGDNNVELIYNQIHLLLLKQNLLVGVIPVPGFIACLVEIITIE